MKAHCTICFRKFRQASWSMVLRTSVTFKMTAPSPNVRLSFPRIRFTPRRVAVQKPLVAKILTPEYILPSMIHSDH